MTFLTKILILMVVQSSLNFFFEFFFWCSRRVVVVGSSSSVDPFNPPYLAKLLNAALCGFIQSGTRPVCNCSAMNLCISSVNWNKRRKKRNNCNQLATESERNTKSSHFSVKYAPLTCWTDVSFRSHKSSNGCAAAGSKSFVYCRIPDDAVKQHLHMHEWYRRRPSSRYGCASASITDILLSCMRSK